MLFSHATDVFELGKRKTKNRLTGVRPSDDLKRLVFRGNP
jgi:hypothetical protein